MKQLVPPVLPALAAVVLCSCANVSNSVVNLSHYDEAAPHFPMMRQEGIIGAIHEATYPATQVDAKYAARQCDAMQAGLLWGAYHFADATDPVRQADHFLNVVRDSWRQAPAAGRSPGVLLVLDFEQNNHYPGGTMRVHQAAEFVERIKERTGKYPGLYASENRIKEIINAGPESDAMSRRSLTRCWLWVANYHYKPRATAPWPSWNLWQYTGDGICDLPRGSYPTKVANVRNAERNIFPGSSSAARSFWRANAWVPE